MSPMAAKRTELDLSGNLNWSADAIRRKALTTLRNRIRRVRMGPSQKPSLRNDLGDSIDNKICLDGIPEFEAKRYEGRLQRGGILLSVHCDTSDEIDLAKKVLKATGAED